MNKFIKPGDRLKVSFISMWNKKPNEIFKYPYSHIYINSPMNGMLNVKLVKFYETLTEVQVP